MADTAVADAPAKESKTPFSDFVKEEIAKSPVSTPTSIKGAPAMAPGLDKEPEKKPKEEVRNPDDDTPQEVRSEAGKSSWKRLKDELAAAQRERDELKSKYDTETKTFAQQRSELEQKMAEAKAAYDPVEFERLKKEREELWTTVRRTRVTELPEFKRNFTEPLERLTKSALETVTPDRRPMLEWLLKQPNTADREERLNDLVSNLSHITSARIANAITQVDDIRSRMESVLAQEKEVSEAYEAQQAQIKERTAAQQKLEAQKALEDAALEIRSAKFPGFTEIEGDDQHNNAVAAAYEKSKALAARIADSGDRKGIAKIAHMAVLTETLLPMMQKQFAEIEELKATISKFQGSTPKSKPETQGGKQADLGDDKRPFSRGVGII